MDKTGDVSIRGNQWQRILRWHRKQKVEGGEDGVEDEEKRDTNLKKLNVKWVINVWAFFFIF